MQPPPVSRGPSTVGGFTMPPTLGHPDPLVDGGDSGGFTPRSDQRKSHRVISTIKSDSTNRADRVP
ncbi:hypothetical protein FD525_06115 [Cutibacterium acnes]|nr:hypothetical protein EGX38_00615 [Cutibacterium acnes]EFS37258.1 hypothetical protein HMPREF9574_02393 [Cutibacterium acnes HL074PA1]EFS69858.1 hypothetical protein HMPREF9616_00367 [Cutibacterium acnes HL007PA1]EFT21528.1 hypothetical protein HMPREF9566_00635 [Cutibacterium acnes HL045PA1]EGE95674.1 hypothetical protein HMPREF9570_00586 [Cutibacterium acnes HL043PA1]PGF42895.1 hypothetical protein B1C73_12135 [Cutibacterium acnes subsp. acnes]RHV99263.1 hypothetical protein DXA85_12260 [P